MTGPSLQKLSSQALAEKLFEFAPDGIVVADGDGRIIELNSQAERMFGYTRAEVLGLPVEALIPERFRALHPAHRQNFGVRPSVRPMGMG
ncbi:MAG: PAS domain S-box protein, partial [Candidatus Acidiferrales bacterium]